MKIKLFLFSLLLRAEQEARALSEGGFVSAGGI